MLHYDANLLSPIDLCIYCLNNMIIEIQPPAYLCIRNLNNIIIDRLHNIQINTVVSFQTKQPVGMYVIQVLNLKLQQIIVYSVEKIRREYFHIHLYIPS